MADEIPEADVEAAGRTYENDDDRHSALDAHQAAEDAHRQDRDTTPYVSHCVVCGKSGGQHPDGRWCGSEQYVTGDWTDVPIVNDVARAIGSAFHRGDDAWTTEALVAIAAARPHLAVERDAEHAAEITRLHEGLGQIAWGLQLAATDFTKEFGDGPSDTRDVLDRVLDLATSLSTPTAAAAQENQA